MAIPSLPFYLLSISVALSLLLYLLSKMFLGKIKGAFTLRDIGIEPQEEVLLSLIMPWGDDPGFAV